MSSNNLGVYLRKKRLKAKLTQKEVSSHLGYTTPQFVSNIERGLCLPPLFIIPTLIKLYGVSKDEITKLLVDDYKKKTLEAFRQ